MSELTDLIDDSLEDLFDLIGDSCTYTPATAAAFTVTMIPTGGTQDGQPDTTGPIMLDAQVSDFAVNPARGDAVTWGGRSYRVLDVRQDPLIALYTFSLDEVR